VPADVITPKVINAILRGGAAKVKEANCALVGGHTIRNPEPIYGLSVTGIVSPHKIIANANARPNDLLVLTKPLGTGIITTGIKRGLASTALARAAVEVMRQINLAGAELGERGLVKGGTDITGYGLLGHLGSMCRASRVGAIIEARMLPVISNELYDLIAKDCIPGGTKENLKTAHGFTKWGKVSNAQRILAADAQTSGGLLLCVAPAQLSEVQAILKHYRTPCAAVIGKIVRSPAGKISVT
jgi:selenide, water dikinase